MNSLKVVDVIGTPYLLVDKMGECLLEVIEDYLMKNSKIELDFLGYKCISSSFLNHSIGQLLIRKQWNAGKFYETVHLANIDGDDIEEIELVLNNAEMRLSLINQDIEVGKFLSTRIST